jgi:hypothetical protein
MYPYPWKLCHLEQCHERTYIQKIFGLEIRRTKRPIYLSRHLLTLLLAIFVKLGLVEYCAFIDLIMNTIINTVIDGKDTVD